MRDGLRTAALHAKPIAHELVIQETEKPAIYKKSYEEM